MLQNVDEGIITRNSIVVGSFVGQEKQWLYFTIVIYKHTRYYGEYNFRIMHHNLKDLWKFTAFRKCLGPRYLLENMIWVLRLQRRKSAA